MPVAPQMASFLESNGVRFEGIDHGPRDMAALPAHLALEERLAALGGKR